MRYSLAAPSRFQLEIRKSRFLAQAAPVADEAAARAFIASHRAADASHNSWAWKIAAQYRSSDDGEPAGTAGRPILAAIDGQGFDRIAVVVTRWFGGIKLGAGGLVRAYGGAAAECLRLAPRLPLVERATVSAHVAFEDLATLHHLLPAFSADKRDDAFDATGARIVLELPADGVGALKTRLRDATRDRARIDESGSEG